MIEVKRKLSGKVTEFQVDPVHAEDGLLIVAYQLTHEYREPHTGLYVPAGTMSYGFFWPDRPYNAYYFVGEDGPIAVYCNLCRRPTLISQEGVDWTDLEIDLLIYPDRRIQILDEEELPDDLSSSDRTDVQDGKQQLLQNQGQSLLQELDEWLAKLSSISKL